MSWLSKLMKGKDTGNNGQGAEDLGMKEYFDAIKEYENGGNNQYSWLGDFQGGPSLNSTEMGKIAVDPRYSQYEQQALRDLEQQSKDGLSARDLADMAQLESQVNRQNSGRIGAIQQNMAARGMGGSGMELVAQMQAAQDATERQALASLEKNAQVQQGRRDATAQLGQVSGQLSARDYQQQAQKAAAQDAINRFNTANQWNQNQMNWQGRQGIANQNVAQNNQFAQNKMQAQQGGAQMRYNSGVEADNRAAMRKQGNKAQMSGIMQGVGTVAGGVLGATAGSIVPGAGTVAGAALGASLGGAAGGAAGSMFYAHGGEVPGQAQVPGDSYANDNVPIVASAGEIVIPRSITTLDPKDAAEAAKLFVKLTQMTSKKKG
jgi:hypothetical protein